MLLGRSCWLMGGCLSIFSERHACHKRDINVEYTLQPFNLNSISFQCNLAPDTFPLLFAQPTSLQNTLNYSPPSTPSGVVPASSKVTDRPIGPKHDSIMTKCIKDCISP